MNFEEMLNAQEGQKPHREHTLLGSFYRRQVDGKFRYFIELRPDLTDSIVFCEALKAEQQWALHQRSKQQLKYELRYDGNTLSGIEIEQGNFITLASLLDQNPAIVASKGFIDDFVKALFDCTAALHEEGIFHLCFAPNNIFLRKNDSKPFLLCHGSAYKGMSDQSAMYAGVEDYVAPEVISGQEPDQHSDIYSIGRLIEYIFSQGSMSYEYKQIVKKATDANPAKRYKSIGEMRDALAQKRNARRSVLAFAAVLVISLLAVYIYVDSLPESTGAIEFEEHPQQGANDLFSSDELDVDTAFLADSMDLSDEALMQKAEMIYRKRYQKVADEILSRVYNKKHMGASEKTFMANTQTMAEDLLKAQQELAGETGLPESMAGRIGHEIVEQLTVQKQKSLNHNGYIKKSGKDKEKE